MPDVLAYGEDALTYWVLTARLKEFLSQLGDDSDPAGVLVVYRPSFGRGGAPKATGDRANTRAEFGEFDGIVASDRGVYLIEAKWSRSSERTAEGLALRTGQVLRHRVLRWHIDAWRKHSPTDWDGFVSNCGSEFEKRFPGRSLAPPGSLLARNLQFLLDRFRPWPGAVRDVLLHIGLPGSVPPRSVSPPDFELVHIEANVLDPGGFFRV